MKSECREIILEVLTEYTYDNDGQQINMGSDYAKNLLASALEVKLKKKFHIFKINKLISEDDYSTEI